MIVEKISKFFIKKWKIIALYFYIVISLFFFLIYIRTFQIDFQNCTRNVTFPHYTSRECFCKYNLWWLNKAMSKCYVVSNDSFNPEVSRLIDARVNIFVLNSNWSEKEIEQRFSEVNDIWNKFGINFIIDSVNLSKSKEKVTIFGNNEKMIRPQLEKYYDLSYSENHNNLIAVISDYKEHEGLHFSHFIIVSNKAKNATWAIAHELGHIMGLYDKAFYSGEINLMTHIDCIKNIYYPTNLNKYQVERVQNITAELYQSQNQ
jgi:hypothetical protein